MYKDHGYRDEQNIVCVVYSHLGNVRAEICSIWMDNSVIKGRTSFVSILVYGKFLFTLSMILL